MKKILIYTIAVLGLTACISNDIPYPVLVPNITEMQVEGSSDIEINYDKRTVTIHMPETADLRKVDIRSVKIDTDVAVPSVEITGVHDFSKSGFSVTFRVYADEYIWRINAVREIERYFTVKGQIGSSAIDPENCRVVVNVSKKTDLKNIEVTSLKLGPKDGISVYSPALNQIVGSFIDLSSPYKVDVTAFDVKESWRIYAEVVESSVTIGKVNAWTTEAYVSSTGVMGMENGFQYRVKGADTWNDVPETDITADGGSFTANIKGLSPETDYEVLAYCGTERTNPVEFRTASAVQLPNRSFEYTSLVAGTGYYKFYDPSCGVEEGKTMFWGSGNGEGPEGVNGSANLGIVITFVDTEDKVDGKQSVCAKTSQMAGMLAAGNLFTGQFRELVGTKGGMVNFGRPWTTRPKALKLYCKYSTGKMDIINGMPVGVNLTTSDYDRAQIKFALGTWNYRTYGGTPDSPVLINTTDEKTFVDFSTDKSTIANGDLIIYNDGYSINKGTKVSGSTDGWIEYTIPLQYRDMETIPTHIVISCAASQYGDYFSGCSKSQLWLDAFELIY
jgi:hypothetical protein